jgi:hypothetical protein
MPQLCERFSTALDIALVRPLACVQPPMLHEVVSVFESGRAVRSIAVVRSLAGVNPFVLSGITQ